MIQVEALTKKYGSKAAVNNLSFIVPDGQVTGFLGPNGSGKSTTMRCILGLDKVTSGTITITASDGTQQDFRQIKNKAAVAGAMLDATWFHPGRSGYNHLLTIAAGAGVSRQKVDECVTLVGLQEVIKKRVGGYSLGMKQRLMLAVALLGDPQHLILDEPVNGLDPEGVSWMRKTIKYFASQGKAVLVSSHLLNEMQLTADRLVVIGKGELIGSYTMSEFLARGTQVKAQTTTPQPLLEQLTASGLECSSELLADQTTHELTITVPENTTEAMVRTTIAQLALSSQVAVTSLYTQQANLEERFLAATSGAQEYKTQQLAETGKE